MDIRMKTQLELNLAILEDSKTIGYDIVLGVDEDMVGQVADYEQVDGTLYRVTIDNGDLVEVETDLAVDAIITVQDW
jgi:hypothetical protein